MKPHSYHSPYSIHPFLPYCDERRIAFYLPPKLEQSTNHGGTFIFNGDDTVFAYYDESPGTHADTFDTVDMVIREATKVRGK